MKSVLVRLEEYLPRASGAEKGALKLLLESPETAVNCSIQQLANNPLLRLPQLSGYAVKWDLTVIRNFIRLFSVK